MEVLASVAPKIIICIFFKFLWPIGQLVNIWNYSILKTKFINKSNSYRIPAIRIFLVHCFIFSYYIYILSYKFKTNFLVVLRFCFNFTQLNLMHFTYHYICSRYQELLFADIYYTHWKLLLWIIKFWI